MERTTQNQLSTMLLIFSMETKEGRAPEKIEFPFSLLIPNSVGIQAQVFSGLSRESCIAASQDVCLRSFKLKADDLLWGAGSPLTCSITQLRPMCSFLTEGIGGDKGTTGKIIYMIAILMIFDNIPLYKFTNMLDSTTDKKLSQSYLK